MKVVLRIFRVFGRHYRKYWKTLALASSCLLAAIAFTAMRPWPLKLILDNVILGEPLPEFLGPLNGWFSDSPRLLLFTLAASIIVISVLRSIFSYVNKFWVSSTGDRIVADIRERVFTHLQRLSLSFHESSRSGNLVYVMTADVKEMKKLLIALPQDFANQLLSVVTYTVVMLVVDWRLGLIALSSVPLIVVFTRHFGGGMRKAMKKKRKREGKVASIIADNVAGVALVQAYGREELAREKLAAENQASLKAQLRALRLQRTHSRVLDFLVTLSMAAVLFFGGRFVLGGDILPGTLIVFVDYMREIYGSVAKLGELTMGVAKALASGERLVDLVENDMVVEAGPDARPAPAFRGAIQFQEVDFSYHTGPQVLRRVSFRVEPGETVALAGHSGAGKSTLISLLLRFYDPSRGTISIDGHDIRSFEIASLREQITILLQDAKLFRRSIRDNIAFGKREATEEELLRAAKLAEAHEFISELPQGYDTVMEEGGEDLSGGQRQRINIARAIVRDTPIVILDEPASGLDARSEARVNAALASLTRDKTTFIVAHRFSTLAMADRVLLLEGGRVVGFGSHESLLHGCEPYRELYSLSVGARAAIGGALQPGTGGVRPAET